MKRIAIIGNGQLGQQILQDHPAGRLFTFPQLDITRPDTWKQLADFQPNIIINAAAFTNVDAAETERAQVLAVNATGPGQLAKWSAEQGIKLVHISTDFVFDRPGEPPLTETDPPNPVNYYGESKLKGDQLVQAAGGQSLILRTAWLYGMDGPNFVLKMRPLLQERPTLQVVTDQIGSPTFTKDLVGAMFALLEADQTGLFHCVNTGAAAKYDLVQAINRLDRSHCAVRPAKSSDFPAAAVRPRYSVLATNKVEPFYRFRPWQTALADYLGSRPLTS